MEICLTPFPFLFILHFLFISSGWRLQIEAASKHVGIDDIELVNCALPRITGSCYSFQVGCDNGACVSSDQVGKDLASGVTAT